MLPAAPLSEPLLRADGAQGKGVGALVKKVCNARAVLLLIAAAAALVTAGAYILGGRLLKNDGFSSSGGEAACSDRESCLKVVDAFLLNQPRQTYFRDPKIGLMQTFGPNSIGGGPCGDEYCKLVEPCPNYAQTPH